MAEKTKNKEWLKARLKEADPEFWEKTIKFNNRLETLEKKLDEDIESRKNWEDAWVKVSNSYLKWNDKLTELEKKFKDYHLDLFPEYQNKITELNKKYDNLDKDFIDLVNLIKNIKELTSEEPTNKSFDSLLEESMENFVKKAEGGINELISNLLKQPKDSEDEKETFIPEREDLSRFKNSDNGSKPPKPINELLEISGDKEFWDKFSPTTGTAELIGIKPNPEYLNQFIESEPPIKDCSNCESVYSPEPSPCATCENHSNWSQSKRLNIDKLAEKAVKIRELHPNFNDYILKFMEAGEKVMFENGFTEKDGYEIMKEVIELYNPEKSKLTTEEYINKLSQKALKFMDSCFNYILKTQNES